MGLSEQLRKLNSEGLYPMHMPGHKRCAGLYPEIEQTDITEISGFDNLHNPQGLILDEMQRASKVYKSDECRFLVGGSTCGNLAAIYACVSEGAKVILQRGSHKSVYNGLLLRKAIPVYLNQETTEDFILEAPKASDLEMLFEANENVQAAVITSPTYEGRVADIKAIAEVCHRHNVILIVDCAHGAHLGFSKELPPSPVTEGADIVIMSLHKTLGSMTQTALLHIVGERVNVDKIDAALDIFETSSPSYVMMDSIVRAVESVEKDGEALFKRYVKKLAEIRAYARSKTGVEILETDDPGKIILAQSARKLYGVEIAELAQECGIELEMYSFVYALAMTSIYDSDEGFERLKKLIDAIDQADVSQYSRMTPPDLPKPRVEMPMTEALAKEAHEVINFDAMAQTSAAFVCVYPPGIPIIAPGEEITSRAMSFLNKALQAELTVTGLTETGFKVV